MNGAGFEILPFSSGLLCKHTDGIHHTSVYGLVPNTVLEVPLGTTYFGLISKGSITLTNPERTRKIVEGDFFSAVGSQNIISNGFGVIIGAENYLGFNILGGPLEKEGRLRYINGCTDTLLVPPVRKGDPCFNHLHFPPHTVQSPHTHPTVRVNMVYRGKGICRVPEYFTDPVELVEGYVFVMGNNTLHSFDTEQSSMDVVTFHPDSDTGMTDDDHPMVNRTLVDGVSANLIPSIRTKKKGD